MTYPVQMYPSMSDCPPWWEILIDKFDGEQYLVDAFLEQHATIIWTKHTYKGDNNPSTIIDKLIFPSENHFTMFLLQL